MEREAVIRAHYEQRIAQLTEQLQLVDSKAASFHMECRALSKVGAMRGRPRRARVPASAAS